MLGATPAVHTAVSVAAIRPTSTYITAAFETRTFRLQWDRDTARVLRALAWSGAHPLYRLRASMGSRREALRAG